MVFRILSAACITLGLAACSASPTPYQVAAEDGGYTDQQLESDRYRVKFEGNSATPRETVEDYALYRAAELTLATGNDYFKVISKEIEPIIGSVRGVSPGFGIGVGGGSGNFGLGVSTGFGGGRADYSYVTYLDIIVFEGEKPENDREAYSAFDVIERLRSAVVGAVEGGETADEGSASSQ
ncbi:MAG: hypothetical protein OEU92_02420 [Alphaproteobacteria bacterium]|nr:hypothetical protein [Alphaproteobacteria bacterium]